MKLHKSKKHHRHHNPKYSDELANGDHNDDGENQSENDPKDDIVQDTGFGTDARLWTLHQRQARSHAQKHHLKHNPKYSDELANGDANDDGENQSENDPKDDIVQDTGFGSDARLWTLHQKKAHSYAQKHHQHQNKKYSDELANGDAADDKEDYNENDPKDHTV